MDYSLAGKDQQQSNQPSDQAGGLPYPTQNQLYTGTQLMLCTLLGTHALTEEAYTRTKITLSSRSLHYHGCSLIMRLTFDAPHTGVHMLCMYLRYPVP